MRRTALAAPRIPPVNEPREKSSEKLDCQGIHPYKESRHRMVVDAAAAVWDNAAHQWLQRGENAPMGRHCDVTIYHNPRCSKSRATLQLLHERGIEPRVVDYLKAPPDAAELSRLLEMLHMKPRDLMRKHEAEYRQEALDDPGLTRETLIHAMIQHPKLIERPIVVANGKAALGRPPENVLEIL